MNRPRLIFAIISTILEEVAIALIFLLGLPHLGIHVYTWVTALIMAAWLSYSIYTFRKGTNALKIGHILGLPNMIGTKGTVVSALNPEGWVKIQGELWSAKSDSGELAPGSKILVTGQSRLKLVVSAAGARDNSQSTLRP